MTAELITKTIQTWQSEGSSVAWATDFDGTISEYVEYQDQAVAYPTIVDALVELKQKGVNVSVITGRPISYLHADLGDKFDLFGSYGSEQLIDGEYALRESGQKWQPTINRLLQQALEWFDEQGVAYEYSASTAFASGAVFVEQKPISFALYTQPGRHHDTLRPRIYELIDALELENLSMGAIDLGNHISIMPQDVSMFEGKNGPLEDLALTAKVVFCGDDPSDVEPARLTKQRGGMVIAVDNPTAEGRLRTPQELLEVADVVVNGSTSSTAQVAFGEVLTAVVNAL